MSRKLKIITVALILASIPIVVFSSHFIQLTLMEHVSLKEFIVRMIAANQNLNVSSPMYGSFYNSSWPTMQAIDVLNALGGFSSIDDDAVLQFLIGPSQTGPVDQPMKSNPEYNEWQAFLIVHTASVLGRLEELPGSLIEQITETIRVNQNSTIETSDWRADRAFLFETARLLNETRYINFTLQKQDIIDWIEPVWILSREIGGIFLDVKALEEISIMERGWAMADLPEMTRKFCCFIFFLFGTMLITAFTKTLENTTRNTMNPHWRLHYMPYAPTKRSSAQVVGHFKIHIQLNTNLSCEKLEIVMKSYLPF